MKLKDKVIVLTGASSGIGFDLMKLLLDEGAYVVGVSRNMGDVRFDGERLLKLSADISKEDEIDRVFDTVLKRFKRINGFIANAGFAYYERLVDQDFAHIDQLFKVNLYSVIYSAQKLKSINQDKPFNYMATLSAVSYQPMPGYALYGASKAGLLGFMDSYRFEMNKHQVLQSVFPVATKTNFFEVADQKEMAWPVQSSEKVARIMLKGLKKNKRNVFTLPFFKTAVRLFPWGFKLYQKKQVKKFNKAMTNK